MWQRRHKVDKYIYYGSDWGKMENTVGIADSGDCSVGGEGQGLEGGGELEHFVLV